MIVFYVSKLVLFLMFVITLCSFALYQQIQHSKQTVSEIPVFSGKAETGKTSYSDVCLVFKIIFKRNLIFFLDKKRRPFIIMPLFLRFSYLFLCLKCRVHYHTVLLLRILL